MKINFPHIDQFSFWVGFVFSCFLFLFLKLFRSVVDLTKKVITEKKISSENKTINIIEENYLKDLQIRIEGLHLASSLFPLSEILIEPRLLAPPPRISPDEPEYTEDFVSSLVPYLPAWPEIAAAFNAPTISIMDALSGNSDIVIVGQPGVGKSVALAYVALLLAQRSSAANLPVNTIPFLVDIPDIIFPRKNEKDSLDLVIESILIYSSNSNQTLTTQFVKKAFNDGNALLLIDGTDELTSETLDHTIEFIKSLKIKYPLTKIITTGIPEKLKGLVTLNFIPFTLACWEPSNQKEFLDKWGTLWSQSSEIGWDEKSQNGLPDSLLLNNWIKTLSSNITPFELTLLVWGCYAGDIQNGNALDAIFAHIRRMAPTGSRVEALETLAIQLMLSSRTTFEYDEAKTWIKEFEPVDNLLSTQIPEINDNLEQKINNPSKELNKQSTIPSKHLIYKLVDSGLLTIHNKNRMRFSHQIFAALLAGNVLGDTDPDKVLELPDWSGKYLTMNYFSALHDGTLIAKKLIDVSDFPLHLNILIVARWIRDASPDSIWRTTILEKLVEIIRLPDQPLGLRGQVLAAMVKSNDEGIRLLLRRMLDTEDAELLQLCILGLAILKDAKSVEPISNLLGHKSPNVVQAACLGLVTIGTHTALDQVAGLMLHAEKEFRKSAAEALANDPIEGHAILREGASINDFLVRWAVVYGLGRINDPWANDLLSKLRLEDDQWLVRNAANEVIERKNHFIPSIPKRLPPPSECPWLIAFAAQKGLGISPNTPATDILLMALTEGTELEKLASLDYLRVSSSPKIFPIFYNLMQGNDTVLREAIFRTIWEMAAKGIHIPKPAILEAS